MKPTLKGPYTRIALLISCVSATSFCSSNTGLDGSADVDGTDALDTDEGSDAPWDDTPTDVPDSMTDADVEEEHLEDVLIDTAEDIPDVPVEGLIAYYPFSGNANDGSGNGYNGLAIGPTLVVDRFGAPASAYAFDGVDDRILVEEFPVLDEDFTCSLWIQLEGSADRRQTFIAHGGSTETWDFAFYNYGVAQRWVVRDRINSPWESAYAISADWVHVVVVYGTNEQLLYVDGALLDTRSIYTPLPHGDSPFLHIGEFGYYYHGVIDDIRIYNRVLEEAEVRALFSE